MHARTTAVRGISVFFLSVLAVLLASCGGGGDSAPAGPGPNTQAIGYVKASNTGAGDQFGVSVALSGDGNTLAVGAPLEDSSTTGINSTPDELAAESGAVYIYTRSAGTWSQQAYVKASNTGANDQFGVSVALSGDGNTLAVGAYLEDSSTTGINSTPNELAADAGAVYVFTRAAGVWTQQAYIKALNPGAGDNFGISITLSGDGNTLAVGAPLEDSSTTGIGSTPDELAPNAGAVYVFTRSAGAWSQQAYVKASNTGGGDQFGGLVALSGDGDTLAVGARLEDSGTTGIDSTPDESAANAGAAYVFNRNAGAWSQQAYVKASNTGPGDVFGRVALSGDGNTLAVGANGEGSSTTGIGSTPDELAPLAGAVYVFTRSAGTWSQQAYVKASNTGAGDQFGALIALSGDGNTLAVGARHEDSSSTGIGSTPDELAPDSGAVYVFARSSGAWSQQAYVKASNTGTNDQFGLAVALNGDGSTLAVGAQFEDSSATGIGSTPDELAANAGAVYVY